MSFSEKVKKEVKEKADFRCCRCHSVGIDVHHIIPKRDGGSDDINNAAPLCQNCHDQFGDNPYKQKEITQMRDLWYKRVEDMYSQRGLNNPEILNQINTNVIEIQQGQSSGISDLKQMLKEIINKPIDDITPGTAKLVASEIVDASANASVSRFGSCVFTNILCKNCGREFMQSEGYEFCPHCGAKIFQ
jgi:hypothetical protein